MGRGKIKVIVIPHQGEDNLHKGVATAWQHIKLGLESIEDYSVYQERWMPDWDEVIVDCKSGDDLEAIATQLMEIGFDSAIFIGGDHLITYPILKCLVQRYPGLYVLHIDAHADRRDTYCGRKFSYATVMRRVEELLGGEHVITLGYRSLVPEEGGKLFRWDELTEAIEELRTPYYLSIDMDVFDPSVFPCVTHPEPGGIRFDEFMKLLMRLPKFVAADIVEFNPHVATWWPSSVFVATVLRELLVKVAAE